jgi:hypothetical protein
MFVAFGTFTPTSTTDVATKMSVSCCGKRTHHLLFLCGLHLTVEDGEALVFELSP